MCHTAELPPSWTDRLQTRQEHCRRNCRHCLPMVRSLLPTVALSTGSTDTARIQGIVAIIEDPDELKRILRHLIKIGRSPPGFEPERLN